MALVTAAFCDKCGHTGWRRVDAATDEHCECFAQVARQQYTKPQLRAADQWYPAELDLIPRWPLLAGRWAHMKITQTQFRHMAWRSIVPHWERVMTYEVVTPRRLMAVQFERDGTDLTIDDFVSTDLLVFLLLAATPNRILGSTLHALLAERDALGKPTWLYQGVMGASLDTMYGGDINDGLELLGPLRAVL